MSLRKKSCTNFLIPTETFIIFIFLRILKMRFMFKKCTCVHSKFFKSVNTWLYVFSVRCLISNQTDQGRKHYIGNNISWNVLGIIKRHTASNKCSFISFIKRIHDCENSVWHEKLSSVYISMWRLWSNITNTSSFQQQQR